MATVAVLCTILIILPEKRSCMPGKFAETSDQNDQGVEVNPL